MLAFLVHQVIGNRNRAFHQHFTGAAAGALFFDLPQDAERQIVIRADQASAVTGVARLGRGLDHPRMQALTAHFHQAKATDPTHLNACPIGFQPVFHALFNRGVVAAFIHVDEINHDEPGKVAQAQLARHLIGGLKIGLQCGFFNRALLGGPPRVHINRHQRFGDADHDIAARRKLHRGVEHATEIAFHLMAGKERHGFLIMLHVLGVARHDHFHEILGDAIAAFAFDQNLVNLAVIEVADRAFDQVALFIDLRRSDGFQRQRANLLPHALQIFVITLDLGFGALGPCRAHDQARAPGHFDLVCDLFELLAVGGVGDLAADAAAACGVGHKHAIAASQAEIGGQRRALVAAFFLDDLHQKDLAHLDDFLNLVAARTRFARRADIINVILIGDRFNGFILGRGIYCARLIFLIVLAHSIRMIRRFIERFLHRRFRNGFHRRDALNCRRINRNVLNQFNGFHAGNIATFRIRADNCII